MAAAQRGTDPATVIRSQVVLDEHDHSPDGRFAVVARRSVVRDRYRSHLWLVRLAGDARRPIQLTDGNVRDSNPRIAPDGSAVVFKRSHGMPGGGKPAPDAEALVLPISRGFRPGRAWALRIPKDRAVGDLAWSPDGRRLALTIEVDPPRFLVGPEPPEGEEPTARRVTRLDWHWDEAGHLDRWSHLHVVDARRGAKPRQRTSGDWGASQPAWSPDGRSIAFTADRAADADLHPRTSIWTIDPDGDTPPRQVISTGGPAEKPAWAPNGRWIAAVAYVGDEPLDDTMPGPVVAAADGSGAPRPLAPTLDLPVGTWNDTDLHGWVAGSRSTPIWADDTTIVATITQRGRAKPWRYPVDPETGAAAGAPEPLTTDEIDAYSLAGTADARVAPDRRVSAVACIGSRPMELVTVPLSAAAASAAAASAAAAPARARRRTTMGGRWSARVPWPEMRELDAPGAGGPIHTWIASPAGAGDAPLPTIVDIHGGPLGAWAPAPSIETTLLCARGYRVVLPNIRGSTSYGGAWIRPHLGNWGGPDAADVHAALDHVIGLGLADPGRLGALGLSYGGFMVNWLMGTTDRFRAGVSVAGVTNQISAWANSDSGVEYNRASLLGAPLDPDGAAKLWRQSPLANVSNVRTPLLLLQGEADIRCGPEDNAQLFTALRVLGQTVEFVLYPEESHVYFTAGRPDRRIDHMTRMLDWFDHYVMA
ncbi:MAG TPA: prolyl oligopeptidase family serine peptidase [Candidatus Limnocylindrales bacterium]|nr:prolyl oligopeptidase family serine peptidase [Candidatus Limnocylindrales bacterium]